MPGYNGNGATNNKNNNANKDHVNHFKNSNSNTSMLECSGKMNIVLVLLALLVLMTGYCCFKK